MWTPWWRLVSRSSSRSSVCIRIDICQSLCSCLLVDSISISHYLSISCITHRSSTPVISSASAPSLARLYESRWFPLHRLSRTSISKHSRVLAALRFDSSFFFQISQWSIRGRNETSIFSAQVFSPNRDVHLQTTANVNLSVLDMPTDILSSQFDLRYRPTIADLLVVLYEQPPKTISASRTLTKPSDLLETDDRATYEIQVNGTTFDSLDFIILQGDGQAIIRLSDLSTLNKCSIASLSRNRPIGAVVLCWT